MTWFYSPIDKIETNGADGHFISNWHRLIQVQSRFQSIPAGRIQSTKKRSSWSWIAANHLRLCRAIFQIPFRMRSASIRNRRQILSAYWFKILLGICNTGREFLHLGSRSLYNLSYNHIKVHGVHETNWLIEFPLLLHIVTARFSGRHPVLTASLLNRSPNRLAVCGCN